MYIQGVCPNKYYHGTMSKKHANTKENIKYFWVKCKVLYWQKTVNQGSADLEENHCINVALNTPKSSLDSLHTVSKQT